MDFEYNHYYEIYNSGSGKYVNLSGDHEDGIVSNGEKVTMYARTNNPRPALGSRTLWERLPGSHRSSAWRRLVCAELQHQYCGLYRLASEFCC